MSPFKVEISDCDGPLDLTDLVLEATMWAKGKVKTALQPTDTFFGFADNIGFQQIMVGDVILVDQIRLPEQMLVVGFDEVNRLVEVQRGYRGTTPQPIKKGTPVRIIKFMGATAQTEMIFQDVLNIDGTTTPNVLTDSFFIYAWGPNDTCLPGCYYLEFKLLKLVTSMMQEAPMIPVNTPWPVGPASGPLNDPQPPYFALTNDQDNDSDDLPGADEVPSVVPSFTPSDLTPADFGCGLGLGVEWVRRFPVDAEGFLIQITNSITPEV
jgi:hypothetical protein